MNSINPRLLVALSIGAALALPSSAFARHGADDSVTPTGEHSGQSDNSGAVGDNHRSNTDQSRPQRTETYTLRGSVISTDPSADTVVVQIQKANHGRRGRALVGQQLTVDLSGARVQVADANGDGARDINDVAAGDQSEVRVELPKSQTPDLSQPLAASRFKDRTAHSSDDGPNHL